MHWSQNTITKKRSWYQRSFVAQQHAHQLVLDPQNFDEEISTSDKLLKHDRTTTVATVFWNEKHYVLKRYNPRSFAHKIKRALRRSRAAGCWNMSYEFHKAGLNVAEPVIMHEQRWGPFCGTAYFVNEHLEGEELLSLLPEASPQLQEKIASAIFDAFEKMEQHRITHGDLKASNILWVDNQLFFIDLDAAKVNKSQTQWQFFHKKDVRRFMKNWRGNSNLLTLFEKLSEDPKSSYFIDEK